MNKAADIMKLDPDTLAILSKPQKNAGGFPSGTNGIMGN